MDDSRKIEEFITKDNIELAIQCKFEQIENWKKDTANKSITKRKRSTISSVKKKKTNPQMKQTFLGHQFKKKGK